MPNLVLAVGALVHGDAASSKQMRLAGGVEMLLAVIEAQPTGEASVLAMQVRLPALVRRWNPSSRMQHTPQDSEVLVA